MSWIEQRFNKQNIKARTEKGVLIAMPHRSEYNGYLFWHPAKLIRDAGGKGYFKLMVFSDNWEFTIFKRDCNLTVTDKRTIGSYEMQVAFGIRVT